MTNPTPSPDVAELVALVLSGRVRHSVNAELTAPAPGTTGQWKDDWKPIGWSAETIDTLARAYEALRMEREADQRAFAEAVSVLSMVGMADGGPLVAAVQTAGRRYQSLQAGILDRDARLSAAAARADQAERDLAAARAEVEQAEAALAAERADRDEWKHEALRMAVDETARRAALHDARADRESAIKELAAERGRREAAVQALGVIALSMYAEPHALRQIASDALEAQAGEGNA